MNKESFLPIVREMVAAGDLYVYEVDGEVAAVYRLARKQLRTARRIRQPESDRILQKAGV